MIFHRFLIEKIKSGEKTWTRRPWASMYNPGGFYSVQPGRTGKGIGRILVMEKREEIVSEISDEHVKLEGFSSREEFFAGWKKMYPKVDPETQLVDVIRLRWLGQTVKFDVKFKGFPGLEFEASSAKSPVEGVHPFICDDLADFLDWIGVEIDNPLSAVLDLYWTDDPVASLKKLVYKDLQIEGVAERATKPSWKSMKGTIEVPAENIKRR